MKGSREVLTRSALTLVLAVMASGPAAHAAPPKASGDRAKLLHLAHEWLHASEVHDRAALDRILADDYVDTSYRGKLRTKSDVLKSSAAPGAASQSLGALKLRILGDTAIMTGVSTVTGPRHAWVAHVRFTDVYMKRNGRWRAVASQETLVPRAH